MKILVFGAHADDAEIGMGGTIAKYATQGHEVKIVCAIIPCENLQGETAYKIKQERLFAAQDAAQILGAKIDILDLDPYKFCVNREHTKMFDGIVQEFVPDRVYVNWHHDTHQNHQNMAKIIFSTARKNNFSLYMYESMIPGGLTPQSFRPQLFVNVSDFVKLKEKSLKTYHSINLFDQAGKAILGRASYRGGQIGVEYAEAFEIVKEIRL